MKFSVLITFPVAGSMQTSWCTSTLDVGVVSATGTMLLICRQDTVASTPPQPSRGLLLSGAEQLTKISTTKKRPCTPCRAICQRPIVICLLLSGSVPRSRLLLTLLAYLARLKGTENVKVRTFSCQGEFVSRVIFWLARRTLFAHPWASHCDRFSLGGNDSHGHSTARASAYAGCILDPCHV